MNKLSKQLEKKLSNQPVKKLPKPAADEEATEAAGKRAKMMLQEAVTSGASIFWLEKVRVSLFAAC